MNQRNLWYVCGAAIGLTASVMFPALASAEEFEPLFNGKDLTGWKGNPALWSVKEGMIVGSTEGNTIEHNQFLISEEEYSDFVLKVSVKLRNHNSGIQFRSEEVPDLEYAVAGYQADVAEKTYFGMLYEERKRGFMPYWQEMSAEERDAVFAAADVDGWNDFVITCEGDRIKMELNGKTTCDIRDPEGAKKGVIALQLHSGPAMEVYFKDIAIKELR